MITYGEIAKFLIVGFAAFIVLITIVAIVGASRWGSGASDDPDMFR